MLSIIVAHDKNNGIGNKTQIPWHLPKDFEWFKKNTMNKTVVMGTTTYFSLPKKFRPLPKRENIVLCNQCEYFEQIENEGTKLFTTIEDVLDYTNDKDTFIIGGASIYNQFVNLVDMLYITKINKEFECDTFFPNVDYSKWKHMYESDAINENDIEFTFNTYLKK